MWSCQIGSRTRRRRQRRSVGRSSRIRSIRIDDELTRPKRSTLTDRCVSCSDSPSISLLVRFPLTVCYNLSYQSRSGATNSESEARNLHFCTILPFPLQFRIEYGNVVCKDRCNGNNRPKTFLASRWPPTSATADYPRDFSICFRLHYSDSGNFLFNAFCLVLDRDYSADVRR